MSNILDEREARLLCRGRSLCKYVGKCNTTRCTVVAASRVAGMCDSEVRMFAQHDPDIFRDIAVACISKITPRPVEFFGGDDDLNCIIKPIED